MNTTPSGFIRRTILVGLVTWAFFHFVLSDGSFVRESGLRTMTKWVLAAIAVWGVLNMLAARIGGGDKS